MDLNGKVAIITGAARGLGREYANALAASGAVAIAADKRDCADTVKAVEASGASRFVTGQTIMVDGGTVFL